MSEPPRVILGREAVSALRPAADAFAEAALAGARSSFEWGPDGRLRFLAEPLVEIHQEIAAELTAAFASDVPRIESRAGVEFARWLDRVLVAWLRAEPALSEFLRPDPRGSGAFLFEVLRAELFDLGFDFLIEPRLEGFRVKTRLSPARLVAPLVAGVWVGAMAGWMVEMLGLPGASVIGLGLGLLLGTFVVVRLLSRRQAACSECGGPLGPEAETCPRCGTALGDVRPADLVETETDAPRRK